MHDTISKNILLSIAYRYFPKNIIDTYGKNYEASQEFTLLKETCQYWYQNNETWILFLNKIKSKFPDNQVRDVSLLSWLDRCYTLDIILNKSQDVIRVISLSVSIISPFYALLYIESNSDKNGAKTLSVNFNVDDYPIANEVKILKYLLKMEDLNPFPQSLLNQIIPKIAFRTIPLDHLTFFNAFFLDEIVNRC